MIGVKLVEELGFERSTLKKFKEISSTDEPSRVDGVCLERMAL